MPHIFPRRFLRTRDVLDTRDMNEDIRPVQELLDGNLDRQNFDGPNLKSILKPRETTGVPSVAEGAYFNIHESMIESTYQMHYDKSTPPKGNIRKPPNFVKLDGSTLRNTFSPHQTPVIAGSDTWADAYPYVVPNTGEWSVLQNASLTGPQQLTFTTGQSKIWLSAFVQYIWQGFYEWKPPWIPGRKTYMGEDIQGARSEESFYDTHGLTPYGQVRAERDVLNAFGPTDTWEYLQSDVHANKPSNIKEGDFQFSFSLNEIHPRDERRNPNLGGNHHISQGFYPCLVQFALRVDGKIIDDSITGKRFSYEESAHGLQAADSLVYEGEDDRKFTVGQRSETKKISFDDSSSARSGQKLSSSRAVACGPEVMPVRIGSVVSVAPGSHTVEIVVRRLSRKRVKFQVGDFVGVFSRRLLAMDIPLVPPRSEGSKAAVTIPNFESEDVIKAANFNDVRGRLADRENKLQSSDVFRGSLPNTHLPSKVAFSQSVNIEPSFTISDTTGAFRSEGVARPAARFPGFGSTNLDRVVAGRNHGWPVTTMGDGGAGFQSASGAGWYKLGDGTSDLKITSTDNDLTVLPNQKLLLFADVELRCIEPILSPWAQEMMASDDLFDLRNYVSFICPERYLDLFALFAIGYKVGDNWTIASKFTPAMVNSFNWVNRGQGFKAESISTKRTIDTVTTYSGSLGPSSEQTWSQSTTIDRRGGHTTQSNIGINVPLMQVVDYPDLGASNGISEVAVFVCSEVPAAWTEGVKYRTTGSGVGLPFAWASPAEVGRRILTGTRVNYGNSRLTAIKLHK